MPCLTKSSTSQDAQIGGSGQFQDRLPSGQISGFRSGLGSKGSKGQQWVHRRRIVSVESALVLAEANRLQTLTIFRLCLFWFKFRHVDFSKMALSWLIFSQRPGKWSRAQRILTGSSPGVSWGRCSWFRVALTWLRRYVKRFSKIFVFLQKIAWLNAPDVSCYLLRVEFGTP